LTIDKLVYENELQRRPAMNTGSQWRNILKGRRMEEKHDLQAVSSILVVKRMMTDERTVFLGGKEDA